MKKVIDIKSVVIGVLLAIIFFTAVGAKNKNNAKFDTITAKEIKIVSPEGKTIANLGSLGGEGHLRILNKEGEIVAILGSVNGKGVLNICNICSKEQKLVAELSSSNGEGYLTIFSKEGKPAAILGSLEGEGSLGIYNKHNKEVASIQANKVNDGMIALYDRYGDFGWGMTGKK